MLIAANASFPAKQQKWMADVARKYKAESGYTVQFRTFASISDEQQQLTGDRRQPTVLRHSPIPFSLGFGSVRRYASNLTR